MVALVKVGPNSTPTQSPNRLRPTRMRNQTSIKRTDHQRWFDQSLIRMTWFGCYLIILVLLTHQTTRPPFESPIRFVASQRLDGDWSSLATFPVPDACGDASTAFQDKFQTDWWYVGCLSAFYRLNINTEEITDIISLVEDADHEMTVSGFDQADDGNLFVIAASNLYQVESPLSATPQVTSINISTVCYEPSSVVHYNHTVYLSCIIDSRLPIPSPPPAMLVSVNLTDFTVTVLADLNSCPFISKLTFQGSQLFYGCRDTGLYSLSLPISLPPISPTLIAAATVCSAPLGLVLLPTPATESLALLIDCDNVGVLRFDLTPLSNTTTMLLPMYSPQCQYANTMILDGESNTVVLSCPYSDLGGALSMHLGDGGGSDMVMTLLTSKDSCTNTVAAIPDSQSFGVLLLCLSEPIRYTLGRAITSVEADQNCYSLDSIQVDQTLGILVAACSNQLMAIIGTQTVTIQPISSVCAYPISLTHATTTGEWWVACESQIQSTLNYTIYSFYLDSNYQSINIQPILVLLDLPILSASLDDGELYFILNPDLFYDHYPAHYNTVTGVADHIFTNSSLCISPNQIVAVNHTVYVSCDQVGVFAINANNFTQSPVLVLSATTCDVTNMFIEAHFNRILAACLQGMIIDYDLTTSTITRSLQATDCDHVRLDYHTNYIWAICSSGLIFYDGRNLTSSAVAKSTCTNLHQLAIDPRSSVLYLTCSTTTLLALSDQFACQTGFDWRQDQCKPCQPGYARDVVDYETASSVYPICRSCSAGSVAPLTGSKMCTDCPVGRFQDTTLWQVCGVCNAGKFSNTSGTTSCQLCDAGRFSDAILSTSCQDCDYGKYAGDPGSAVCNYCTPGRHANYTGQTRCYQCFPGHYASDIGFRTCHQCQPGTYTTIYGSFNCAACFKGTASDEWARNSTCPDCRNSEQPHFGATSCVACQLGNFANQGSSGCIPCEVNSYTPAQGADCLDCSDQPGLDCFNGLAHAKPGYWGYQVYDDNLQLFTFRTTPCPDDNCPGGLLQDTTAINGSLSNVSALVYCEYPRLNDPNNWLCAACVSGHVAWSDSCVDCRGVNPGLATGVCLFALILVIFLLYGGTRSPYLAILLFFVQTAALEIGPVIRWLQWIEWTNLSAASTTACLAPLEPLQQILLTFLLPFILMAFLLVVMIVRYGLFRYFRGRNRLFATFSTPRYVGCIMSILLFSYTPVTVAVVRALNCVQVAPGVTLLFSMPTVNCDSSEYHAFFPVVILWLTVFVLGFPVTLLIFLWRYRSQLYKPTNDTEASRYVLHQFQRRWGPLYLLYAPHAFFWPPLLLLRRFFFALTAVLIHDNSSKYSLFGFLSFASLLGHLLTRPFESDRLNHVETVSYSLLVCLSLLLASTPSAPYPIIVQVLSFMLVIPISSVLLVWTARSQVRRFQLIYRKEAAPGPNMKAQKHEHHDHPSTNTDDTMDKPNGSTIADPAIELNPLSSLPSESNISFSTITPSFALMPSMVTPSDGNFSAGTSVSLERPNSL